MGLSCLNLMIFMGYFNRINDCSHMYDIIWTSVCHIRVCITEGPLYTALPYRVATVVGKIPVACFPFGHSRAPWVHR